MFAPDASNLLYLRCFIGFVLACGLAWHGLRKKSLAVSGSIAAFFVGFIAFVTSFRFGLVLILFYYSSSKLTKINEKKKASLEDAHKKGGQRNAIQVLANSFLGSILCLAYFVLIGEDQHVSLNGSIDEDFNQRLQLFGREYSRQYVGFIIWSMYIAHYSCATADTWASELGVLSKQAPRLVTTFFWKQVPPGTNGGMSLLGTLASAAGGLFIGIVFLAFLPLVADKNATVSQVPMVLVGLITGVLGSLFDSLLGATVQATYYSHKSKSIVKSETALDKKKILTDKSVELITGIDILSGEAVNFFSIFLTMLCSIYIGPLIFCLCDKSQCLT